MEFVERMQKERITKWNHILKHYTGDMKEVRSCQKFTLFSFIYLNGIFLAVEAGND